MFGRLVAFFFMFGGGGLFSRQLRLWNHRPFEPQGIHHLPGHLGERGERRRRRKGERERKKKRRVEREREKIQGTNRKIYAKL